VALLLLPAMSGLDLVQLAGGLAGLGLRPPEHLMRAHEAAVMTHADRLPHRLWRELRAAYAGLGYVPAPQLRVALEVNA
jgi:hypothetical protein